MRSNGLVLLSVTLLTGSPLAAQRIALPAKLPELETRARQDSNDAAAQYNVALGYWNEKRWDDADSALHRAIRIDPQFAMAYVALAALPYQRRSQLADEEYDHRVPPEWEPRIRESERLYRQAMMIDPLVDVRLGFVILPNETGYKTSLQVLFGDWLNDYVEGVVRYFDGKYQQSYDDFQRVVYQIKGDQHAERMWNTLLFWHGLAAAQVGKNADAVWDFQKILNRHLDAESRARDSTLSVPLQTNEFRYLLAVMNQRAGNLNEATQLYRQAIENDVGLYMAHVRLAQIYETANLWDQAVAERRAAVNASPDNPSLLVDLGRTLANARRTLEAEQTFRQAMDANPRDARIPYYLGRIEEQLSKPTDARAAYTRFLSIAPSRYATQIADAKQRLETLH